MVHTNTKPPAWCAASTSLTTCRHVAPQANGFVPQSDEGRPTRSLDPNGHPNPIAQKLRVLLMHLGLHGTRLLGVSWCSSARYRAADHHHQVPPPPPPPPQKKVECGVGGGAHAHRKNPEAHCEEACTRACCRGLIGQVTPIPSLSHHF